MFKKESGDWKIYKQLPNSVIVDFHYSDADSMGSYHENMEWVYEMTLNAIEQAQKEKKDFVIFTHGCSTSRRGKTTSRSQVRTLMRSKDATPYIIRKECIQHYSVFVAAIRH